MVSVECIVGVVAGGLPPGFFTVVVCTAWSGSLFFKISESGPAVGSRPTHSRVRREELFLFAQVVNRLPPTGRRIPTVACRTISERSESPVWMRRRHLWRISNLRALSAAG